MNKSKCDGDWWDYTTNPVTGCTKGCTYCYAAAFARRFHGDPDFRPRLHPERLADPGKERKPSRIFMVSMGDLFDPEVTDEWRLAVWDAMWKYSWHTFYVLTKQAERMCEWVRDNASAGSFGWTELHTRPRSAMAGNVVLVTTCTSQRDADERLPWLRRIRQVLPHGRLGICCEPLLGPITLGADAYRLDWLVIGAQTTPVVVPKREWVEGLLREAGLVGLPVYVKGNLSRHYPDIERREWPEELRV